METLKKKIENITINRLVCFDEKGLNFSYLLKTGFKGFENMTFDEVVKQFIQTFESDLEEVGITEKHILRKDPKFLAWLDKFEEKF